jgi:hypothetical protein
VKRALFNAIGVQGDGHDAKKLAIKRNPLANSRDQRIRGGIV